MEEPANKTPRTLHSVVHTIAHPRRTIKRKVKRSTAWGFKPVDQSGVSKKHDVELVDAYDDLSRAESDEPKQIPGTPHEQAAKAATSRRQEKVRILESQKKELQVEWAISHVNRVRVVSRSPIQPLSDYSFKKKWNGESQTPWKELIGHVRPDDVVID